MKLWDSADVVAVMLDMMKVMALVERDVFRGVGTHPSKYGGPGGG